MNKLLRWVVIIVIGLPTVVWANPHMVLGIPHISCDFVVENVPYKYLFMTTADDLFGQKTTLKSTLWIETDEASSSPLEGRLLFPGFLIKADKKFTVLSIEGDLIGLFGPLHAKGKVLNQKTKQKVEFTFTGTDDAGKPFIEKQTGVCLVRVLD